MRIFSNVRFRNINHRTIRNVLNPFPTDTCPLAASGLGQAIRPCKRPAQTGQNELYIHRRNTECEGFTEGGGRSFYYEKCRPVSDRFQ